MDLLLKNSIGTGRLEKRSTAILAIHWQVDAVKPEGAFGPAFAETAAKLGVIERTAGVLAVARAHQVPIIYINVCFWPGFSDLIRNNALFNTVWNMKAFVRGTKGAEVIPELTPQAGDYVFSHSRISAFYGTDLEATLKGLKIETLVFTGIATNVAVDHSVRDAAQLGFSTVILNDCCCTSTPEYHEASLMTLRVLATQITDSETFCRVIEAQPALT